MNPRVGPRDLIVAVSVIGAGLIHLAAIRPHLGSTVAVVSFVTIGLLQILLGAAFLRSGASRLKRVAVIGVGTFAITSWLLSRTWGLPALSGHTGPEPFGPADLAAAGLQLIALVCAALPMRTTEPGRRRVLNVALALPLVAVTALASSHLLAVPEHGHSVVVTRTAREAPWPGRADATVIKRVVPTDHVDTPDAPAHSH